MGQLVDGQWHTGWYTPSSKGAFERPPETIRGVARELIRGVYKLKDQLVLVLDTTRAVDITVGDDVAPAEDGARPPHRGAPPLA